MAMDSSESVRIQVSTNPSGTVRNTSPELWSALGFPLPALLTEVWDKQESRMDIDPAVDVKTRYDVVATPAFPDAGSTKIERIRRAIGDQLRLSVTVEMRSMDIWILTSPANPAAHSPAFGARAGSYSINGEFDPALAAVLRTPEGMEEWFRSNLRRVPAIGFGFPWTLILPFSRGVLQFARPEEDGSCQIQMEWFGGACTEDQFVQGLREELGIAESKEHHSVEMLVVRPQ